MRIVMTGATGFIGKAARDYLVKRGHDVRALRREEMDPQESLIQVLTGAAAIINLAGEPIDGGRWTEARKKKILQSRVEVTRKIVAALRSMAEVQRPRILISTSAVGFYGDRGEELLTEESLRGPGFLADVCVAWEKEALAAKDIGLRVVITRFGIVLARGGGVLKKMQPVILGTGNQWISWIHRDDVVRFMDFALENQNVEGLYNLTSPDPRRNADFMAILAKIKKFPLRLKAPGFLLKAAMGEMSELVLQSQQVFPERTQNTGFKLEFTDLVRALENSV